MNFTRGAVASAATGLYLPLNAAKTAR